MKLVEFVKNHYTKIVDEKPDQKLEKYQCKYCVKQYSLHSTRMAIHLAEDCKGAPEDVKLTLRKLIGSPTVTKKRKYSCTISNDENVDVRQLENCRANPTSKIEPFFDQMSETQQKYLNTLFAKAVYSSGKICIS